MFGVDGMNWYRFTRAFFGKVFVLGIGCILFVGVLYYAKIQGPQYPIYYSDAYYLAIWALYVAGVFGIGYGLVDWGQHRRAMKRALQGVHRAFGKVGELEKSHSAAQPSYLLADSIDRELLMAVRDFGGDIVAVEARLSERAIGAKGEEWYNRLAKLQLLGLVYISEDEGNVLLTSAGLDALQTPAALFVSRVPDEIWKYTFQSKIELWAENWYGAIIEGGKALEAILHDRIAVVKEKHPRRWGQIRTSVSSVPIRKWSAGKLLQGLRDFGYIRERSFEDMLIGDLVRLRNRIHRGGDTTPISPGEASRFDMYLGILLRIWYGPK